MPMRSLWPRWRHDGRWLTQPPQMILTTKRWLNRRQVSVVGITRFSLIFRRNHPFRDKADPFDVRAAHLFDEARLRRRFDIWEAVTLPSLAAQTTSDFSILVVTSSLLPEWAKMRLQKALAAQPFASLIAAPAPTTAFSKLVRQNVRELANTTYGGVGTFRLDDDDALAADFIERFKAEIEAGRRQKPSIEIYGFENGWFLAAYEDGLKITPVQRKLIACGLGRISTRSPLRTIHDPKVSHTKLAETLPTRHCGGPPTWIVTAHDLNDSNRMGHEGLMQAPVLTPAAAREALGPSFSALDLCRVAEALRR